MHNFYNLSRTSHGKLRQLDVIFTRRSDQGGTSHPRYDNTRSAEEYGYKNGTILGSSGHLRVRVSGEKADVDYVRAFLPADETGTRKNGAVAFSYEVQPR